MNKIKICKEESKNKSINFFHNFAKPLFEECIARFDNLYFYYNEIFCAALVKK